MPEKGVIKMKGNEMKEIRNGNRGCFNYNNGELSELDL